MHATHGLVFVRDPMRCQEAERYGLSPLLIYALSIQDTVIRRMTFAPMDQPLPIFSTLHRLWAQEADCFRGLPDAVVLSRQVAAASPTLDNRLATSGVELIVAEKGDKVSGAALRTAQQQAMWLRLFSNSSRRIDTLHSLEEAASYMLHLDLEIYKNIKYQQHHEQWTALPCRPVAATAGGDELDWTPGTWLVSWEENLPPVSQPRYFHNDDQDGKMWLLTGSGGTLQDGPEEDDSTTDQEWTDEDDSTMVSLAKDLVTCWPNSASEIARSIGTTAREMKWFLDGKAVLDECTVFELLSVLGIERRGQGYYEASGPCVLVAKDVHAATRIYDELSHGGDLTFSYEVVPESGQTDPSWRYLLFQSCGGCPNIMMFERGSKAADRLIDKFFINFEGVRSVPSKLYRDVVATAARASRSPLANRREILGFDERLAVV